MDANAHTEQDPSLELAEAGVLENASSIPGERQRSRVFPQLRRVALVIAVFVLLLIALGAAYQAIEARADARRFPQEGKSVDVGGYRLNIQCAGQGSPTVVLEAGLTVPAISWRPVQREIAKFTRVCSYDRAGYDWSDPGPMPRTSSQSMKELHLLLRNAGEIPPYVLVGHSFGGTNVRIYNWKYPSEVVGMVLVEPGHEDLRLPDSLQNSFDADLREHQRGRKWAPLLYRIGYSRFMARDKIDNPTLPYDQQEWGYFAIQPKFYDAAIGELENLEEGKDELRAAGTLGNKPLIVLIARESLLDLPIASKEKTDLNKLWVGLEIRLASLSSRGKWVIVPNTGHMIPFQRPDVIVGAVKEVWVATR